MRKDMYKLITECYRYGGSESYKAQRHRLNHKLKNAIAQNRDDAFDVLDNKESMRKHYKARWVEKEFGENLPPLKRFLISSAGRLWDEVHSEMASHINCNSEAQRHVWLHAVDYVEDKTFIGDDGEVWYNSGYTWGWDRRGLYCPISESWSIVYVHPETKRLVKTNYVPRWRRNRSKAKEVPRVIVDDFTQCHLIFDDWYLVTLAQIPDPVWTPWREKRKKDLSASIEEAKSDMRWSVSAPSRYVNNEGRWVFPRYKDVATRDIETSWNIRNGSRDYGFSLGQIYGLGNVYAKNRKQMNTQELRRYGIKHVAGKEGEYFRK